MTKAADEASSCECSLNSFYNFFLLFGKGVFGCMFRECSVEVKAVAPPSNLHHFTLNAPGQDTIRRSQALPDQLTLRNKRCQEHQDISHAPSENLSRELDNARDEDSFRVCRGGKKGTDSQTGRQTDRHFCCTAAAGQ